MARRRPRSTKPQQGAKSGRPSKSGRGRSERSERSQRAENSERSKRSERSERPKRAERPERPQRPQRPERPERPEQSRSGKSGPPRGKFRGPKRNTRPAKGRPPRGPRPEAADEGEGSGEIAVRERLQKVLAAAGIASRRECEELIVSGRVEVDRKTVVQLGTRVDPLNQEIRVDGVTLPKPKRLYYAVHKPVGVVTTNYDPSGRPRVIDLVPTDQRIFPVGRLDRTSEGLILVTNDGSLANLLTHPRYGVDKTYVALVDGYPDHHTLEKLREGVHIAEGLAQAASVKVKRRHPSTTELIIVLNEGRNRQIRRMLARVGHKVLRLKRIAVGPLLLGNMPPGAHRKLANEEVELLLDAVRSNRKSSRKKKRRADDGAPVAKEGRPPAKGGRPRDDRPYEGIEEGSGADSFDEDDDILLSEETLGARGTDSTGAVLDWNADWEGDEGEDASGPSDDGEE